MAADNPIPSKEGHRFFANDFMESISCAEDWSISLGWIPVACWFISKAATMIGSLPELALLVFLGVLIWTAMEYALHRLLFHVDTDTFWGNTIYFILNGYHIKSPMDGSRLVSAPSVVAVVCFPVYGLVRLFSTPATAPAVFGGWLLGYVMYDVTRYYLHHGHPRYQLLKNLNNYHIMNNHFGTAAIPKAAEHFGD